MHTETKLHARPTTQAPCITIIGMAGSGKSTIGCTLAEALGWAFLDTDLLLEAAYGTRLQDITDRMSRDQFLDAERDMVCTLRASRCVISTGGSVVYREDNMTHLATLGPIVCLDASLDLIRKRIALNPERGLVIAPGQTLEDLYNERKVLYDRFGQIHCDASLSPAALASAIISELKKTGISLD